MYKRFEWRGLERDSLEVLVPHPRDGGWEIQGDYQDPDYFFAYRVIVDTHWNFRSLEIRMGLEDRVLRRDESGVWTNESGQALDFLREAHEVDMTVSAFTNTLAIGRLGLQVGESADIVTAYVECPAFTVTTDPQRYTRLAEDRYEYKSLDSDFTREITVDEDGFVLEYPGLFVRQ